MNRSHFSKVGLIVTSLFALTACTTANVAPVSTQQLTKAENTQLKVEATQQQVQSKAVLEVKTPEKEVNAPEKEVKLLTYDAKEYGFQIKYPEGWEVRDRVKDGMGIIVTANDDPADESWGGTALNIHVKPADGDYGMGWKETKTDTYVNWTGESFKLTYSEPDPNFDSSFSSDKRSIHVSTKLVPGLVTFGYDQKTNPDGEKQLKLLLENFIALK